MFTAKRCNSSTNMYGVTRKKVTISQHSRPAVLLMCMELSETQTLYDMPISGVTDTRTVGKSAQLQTLNSSYLPQLASGVSQHVCCCYSLYLVLISKWRTVKCGVLVLCHPNKLISGGLRVLNFAGWSTLGVRASVLKEWLKMACIYRVSYGMCVYGVG
jgi:hypothetical protein